MCSVSGSCLCDVGWAERECQAGSLPATAAAARVACKARGCVHGWCGDKSGACNCLPGWAGRHCNESAVGPIGDTIIAAAAAASAAASAAAPATAAAAGASAVTARFHCAADKECNGQGICRGGACYCITGFYGEGCERTYELPVVSPARMSGAARPVGLGFGAAVLAMAAAAAVAMAGAPVVDAV